MLRASATANWIIFAAQKNRRPALHRGSKEMPACAPILGKSGPKLQQVKPRGTTTNTNGNNSALTIAGEGVSIVGQAETLDGAAGPSIYTALQEQLGLKLQTQKLPVKVIVVGRVVRAPTEN